MTAGTTADAPGRLLRRHARHWVFTTVGLVLRSPSAVMNAGFMAIFPLIFLSNIFVEPSTLPSALEAFVGVNPISHLVTAVRGAMAGAETQATSRSCSARRSRSRRSSRR